MKIYLKKSITLILALVFCASFLYAEGLEKGKKQTAGKVSGSPAYTWLNINNVSTWVYDNGNSDITTSGDAGFIYPKGSGKNVFFESGPIWGGSMNGYYTIGGSAYRQGLTPGRVVGTTPDDPSSPNVRIYRVRSDYKNFTDSETMNTLFSAEIKDEGLTAEQIYAQYDLDWQQWPAAWGAPFIDKNGDGIYEPDVDIPGVSEEPCQTIWWVANDFDPAVTTYLYGGLPLKVEVQATFFAFKTTGPLGNTVFRKYKLINKNTIKFDSMYFCMWSDPDLGGAFDDFAGCDTTLSLGFVYNGQAKDDIYGLTPPAAGFDFFQGPRIPGLPTDSAKFLGNWVKGYKGLGMTSFFYFSQGVEADFSDPVQGNYQAVQQWRNMFEGKLSRSGTPYIDPITKKPTKFPLSGDPVTKTGWVDGILHAKNDRRFGQVSGPFTMNAGDTQEVVVGQLAAGAEPGINYLNAVSVLKFYDRSAQAAYDNDFKVATPPPAPQVKTTELEKSVILSWSDLNSYIQSESFSKAGFNFEGYNVYQLPSATSTIANAVRVATYDIVDNVAAIVSPDQDAGQLISRVTAYGTDSGIQRTITITDDKVRQVPVLYPGTRYYFAVTAYAYNPSPNAIPNMLESTLNIVTVTPQAAPGVRYNAEVGSPVTTTHVGTGVGTAVVKVVDPGRVTGDNYEIRLQKVYYKQVGSTLQRLPDANGATTSHVEWFVKDLTTSTDVLSNQTVYGGSDAYTGVAVGTGVSNAAGLNFNLAGSLVTGKFFDSATLNGDPNGFTYASSASYREWYNDNYDFLTGYWGGTNGGQSNYGINFPGVSSTDPNILKNDIELRWTGVTAVQTINGVVTEVVTSGGSMATLWTASYYSLKNHPLSPYFGVANTPFLIRIPYEAWDTENNMQITCLVRHREGKPGDNPFQVFNTTGRMYVDFLHVPYDETTVYDPNGADVSWMSNLTWMISFWGCHYTVGDVTKFIINNPLGTGDKFTFTAPSVTTTADLMKEDVNKVNVFPNPYYGVNPQEINKYQRFVTFTHLPANATIKIFNIAGQLVRTIVKDPTSGQFLRWDLATDSGLPVASGIYVAYIDMPDQGVVKKLKVAIIQEQQFLDRF